MCIYVKIQVDKKMRRVWLIGYYLLVVHRVISFYSICSCIDVNGRRVFNERTLSCEAMVLFTFIISENRKFLFVRDHYAHERCDKKR